MRQDFRGNRDRLHGLDPASSSDADNGHRPRCNVVAIAGERAAVADSFFGDFDDADVRLEFIFETQRLESIQRKRSRAASRSTEPRMGDGQSGISPQGVFCFLHIAEIRTEVDDAGGIGFIELHTPLQSKLKRQWLSSEIRCNECRYAAAERNAEAGNRPATTLRETATQFLHSLRQDNPPHSTIEAEG